MDRRGARQAITNITASLLRRQGHGVTPAQVDSLGAARVLRRCGVPLAELGVHGDWLVATGHATLGDLGQPPDGEWDEWSDDDDDDVVEDWWRGGEEGYGERADEEEAWPEGYDPDEWRGGEEGYGERYEEEEGLPDDVVPPGFIAPGAVPIRPANWDLTTDPARYRVAGGDTLVGLAKTYLGDGQRWTEIWALQPQSYKDSGRSPDWIMVGDWLAMPAEAADKVRGEPGVKGGGKTTPWGKVALLAGVAVASGAVVYVATR